MTDLEAEIVDFQGALLRLPTGYFRGELDGRSWGVTLRRSDNGRRIWLFAEELAGNDIVSFNLYQIGQMRPLLKPCEMSSSKVIDFVLGIKPDVEKAELGSRHRRACKPRSCSTRPAKEPWD